MSSLSRQRGVTEFQPKRVVSIPNPMDKGQTNNPNVSPSGYLGFACHGSSNNTDNTTKFPDWLIFQN